MRKFTNGALWLGLAVAIAVSGCKGGLEDPILRLGAAESLAEGKEFLALEKYARARPYFIHAYEVEPNSAIGREALLLAADAHFFEGGSSNYLQAEGRYRDFINRFPTSERSAYAQFQVANSLAQRMEKPDRDQSTTREALAAFEDLLRLYPTSEYAAEAREKMRVVRDNLAAHELMVGQFYLNYRMPIATVGRLESLLEEYPDFGRKDEALFHLGQAYVKLGRNNDAIATFKRLERQFPDGEWTQQIPQVEPKPEEKVAEAEADATPEGAAEGDSP